MKSLILLCLVTAIVATAGIEELKEKLDHFNDNPVVTMLLVFDSERTGPLDQQLEQVVKPKAGFVDFVAIDCAEFSQEAQNSFMYCSAETKPKLPALFFSEPPLNLIDPDTNEKRMARQVQFQGRVQEKAIFDTVLPLLKAFSRNLNNMDDLNKFVADNAEEKRIIFFTDKQNLSPLYKALTANFRYKFAFAHIFSNSSLCETMGVTSFPKLLLNQKEQLKISAKIKQQIDNLKKYAPQDVRNIVIPENDNKAVLSVEQLEEKIFKNPVYSMVHVSAGKPHPQWKTVQSKFQKMFEYHEAGESVAKELGVKRMPAIIYFPRSLVKKQLHKTVFHEHLPFQKILEQLSGMMEDYSVGFSSEIEMQKLTGLALREKKMATVLFHHNEPSLTYRVLTNNQNYKDKLIFFRYKDPDQGVIAKYQIKKLPAILVMFLDQEKTAEKKNKQELKEGQEELSLRVAMYNGKYLYNEMKTFFDTLSGASEKAQEEALPTRELVEINSQKLYNSQCTTQDCFLLLVDGAQKTRSEGHVQTVKKLSKYLNSNFGWLDATCHQGILNTFDVLPDELPILVKISNKGAKYSRLIGRITEENVKQFAVKTIHGQTVDKPTKTVTIESMECTHQKTESTQSFLTQQQKAILKQIRQEEQKKRTEYEKQLEAAEKGKKKKKKKKVVESQDSDL